MKTQTTYKCRSECFGDIARWYTSLDFHPLVKDVSQTGDFSDCECIIVSCRSLNELRKTMSSVSDCHVMAETLKPVDQYTGNRIQ